HHGLPRPRTNVHIRGIEVDFLFAEASLVVEVEGDRYHGTAFARRNDADKQARLEAAGYRVIRLTWHQVTEREAETVTRLKRALAPPRGLSSARSEPIMRAAYSSRARRSMRRRDATYAVRSRVTPTAARWAVARAWTRAGG